MRFLVPRRSAFKGVLNTIANIPAVALSMRKLNATYAGPAIKVSRSADSNTLDVYFDIFGNLNISALMAFAGSGSANVITWYDQSGNHRDMVLSNGSAPQIVNNGTLSTQNYRASIRFNGQYLTSASTTVNAQSVNVVAQSNNISGSYPTFIRQKNDSGPEWAFRLDNSTSANRYAFYSLPSSLIGGYNDSQGYLVVTAVSNTNNSATLYGNGSVATSSAGFTPNATTGILAVGANPSGGEPMNGYISELFVFETSLSDAQRTILETSQLGYYINNTNTAVTGPTASTGNNATAATAATSVTGPTSGSGSNATGATNVYTVNPAFADGAATRYDLKASNSSITVNSPTNVDIIPNGNWSGQTLNLALTKGSGNFPATLTAPSSGNSVISFNYTPTISGEHSIRVVSNLYAPLTHPINAYNNDNGTPSAISSISLVRSDQAPHQYNVLGKKPNGFENINCVGWSRVPFNITLTKATNAIYIKLIDALSLGANTNLNTGTYLNTTPIQVYGPLAAGSYTINLLLPAALYYYFAEFASDSAFTNPIRVANRFTCGLVVGINQRSMECAIARNYSYGTTRIDANSRTTAYIQSNQLVVIKTSNNDDTFFVGMNITDAAGNHALISSSVSGGHGAGTYNLSKSMPDNGSASSPASLAYDPALNQTYDRGVTSVTYDTRYGGYNSWYRHDGYTPGPDSLFGEGSSAATMRFAELVGHYLGVTVGFSGASIAGGGVDSHINHDGTPVSGFTASTAYVDGEFRWAWFNNIGWDGNQDPNYPTELFTEVTNRIITNCDYTMKTNPSVSLIGLNYGCIGWNLNDGSRQAANGGTAGEYRMKDYLLNTLKSPHIFDKSSSGMANGLSPNSHPGQGHRTVYAEVSFRKFLYAEVAAFGGLQTKQTGPKLSPSGTIVRGSNQVKIGFIHHGGTSMNVWALSFDPNDPTRNYRAPTGAELASVFTLYAGANSSSGGVAVMIDTVVLDNTNNLFILNLTPGQNLQDNMTLQFNCDFGISNYTIQPNRQPVAVFCADNNTDTSIGLNIGNQIVSQLDIPITTV